MSKSKKSKESDDYYIGYFDGVIEQLEIDNLAMCELITNLVCDGKIEVRNLDEILEIIKEKLK